MAVDEERLEAAAKKFSRRAKGQGRLLRAHDSAKLGEVASGSAMQGLWLRNRKVESQVSSVDWSRLLARGAVREVRGGGRREYTISGLIWVKEKVVCHASVLALAMTDEAHREEEM